MAGNVGYAALERKIKDRTARIGIVGLGYVGLPLAVEFAQAGFRRRRDRRGCAQGRARSTPASPTSRTCRTRRSKPLVADGKIRAQADYKGCGKLDAILIAVPTPLRKTKDPDISYIVASLDAIAPQVRQGPADHPRVHDVPRDDRRGHASGARRRADSGRPRHLPRLLARAGRSGKQALPDQEHAQGRRRHDAVVHEGGGAPVRSGDRATSIP